MLYIGGWGLLVNMGLPFYTVFLLRHIGLSIGTVALLTTTGSLGALLTLKVWGGLIDRIGSRPVLGACTVLWSLAGAASWFVANSGSHWHLYLNYLVVGAATAGFQLCQFNLMIRMAPPAERADYIAGFLSFTSLLTAAGPLLGGAVLTTLPEVIARLGVWEWRHYQALFVLPLLAGLGLLRLLPCIREPEEQPAEAAWKMIRSMKTFNPLLGVTSAVEFLFTPRGMLGLARTSLRTLRRQARSLTDVGATLFSSRHRRRRHHRHPARRIGRHRDHRS
jgi:MFS family permease